MQGERKSADCRKRRSGREARGGTGRVDAASAAGEHSIWFGEVEKAQHKLLRENS